MKLWVWVGVLSLGIGSLAKAAENAPSHYYVDKKNSYNHTPLCGLIAEIANLPENAHVREFGMEHVELVIPSRYKDFKPVEWTPIAPDQLDVYVNAESMGKLSELKNQPWMRDKYWDGIGDWIFETSQVNIDHNDGPETMVRYRLPSWKYWNVMLADTEPQAYRATFPANGPHGSSATVFYYMGRAYVMSMWQGGYVMEPTALRQFGTNYEYLSLISNSICNINFK